MSIEALIFGALALIIIALLLLRRAPVDPAVGAISGKVDALAAGQDRQAERLAAQERALAQSLADTTERLTSQMLDQTKAMNTALVSQLERIAAQERALADAIAAQNTRLEANLGTQAERLAKQLAEQAQTTATTAAAIQERLAVIDAARANIEALGGQVLNLSSILDNKQKRGAFGETQLETLIQDRLAPEAYSFQHTLSNGRRADCFIMLPHPPGPVAVDSKFPLEAWIALRDATDDAARVLALRQLRTDVQKHLRDVAERYIIGGETAEGALVFVPSEAIYADLHINLAEVLTEGARRGVHVVSPTTLWAMLTSMRALMRDVRMRAEAQTIQQEVRLLLADVGRLEDRVGNLRKHFDQAAKDIEQIEISTRAIKRRGERVEAVEFEEAPAALPQP